MERAVSFVDGDTLTRAQLDFIFAEIDHGEERTERMAVDADVPFKDAKQQVVEAFEKEYLVELLKTNNFNLSKASREAKIDRKHLRNLLKKYDISTKEE
jgi:DNA-binding NtrC family response regulator